MFLDTTSTSYIIYFFLVKLVKWSQLLTVAIVSHLLSVFLSANALTANYSLCLAEMEDEPHPHHICQVSSVPKFHGFEEIQQFLFLLHHSYSGMSLMIVRHKKRSFLFVCLFSHLHLIQADSLLCTKIWYQPSFLNSLHRHWQRAFCVQY